MPRFTPAASATSRIDSPAPQLLGFCAGSLAMPILFGGAVLERGAVGAPVVQIIENTLLADAALDQRIELALTAISNPQPAARTPRTRKAKSKP